MKPKTDFFLSVAFCPLLSYSSLILFPPKTTVEVAGNIQLNAVDIGLGLHSQSFTHYPVTGNNTYTTSLLLRS